MTRAFEEVVVAVAQPGRHAWESDLARMIVDDEPYHGPVPALENAMREIRFDRAFVCSCDAPFINRALARRLCDMLDDYDVLIPEVGGKLQTLHAVYRRDCAKVLGSMREQGEQRLHRIASFAKVRIVSEEEIRALDPDPELLSFFNVNTPEDYQRALKLIAERYKM
jgi:molybdopterin-guanine dinucleotide biosynthesis protein A